MGRIRDAIYEVVEQDKPMTVRQVFYRLVSAGVIAKTEPEYKRTVVRLLSDMRRQRDIPFGWIADNTRWMRKPVTYSSAEQALRQTAKFYRRSVWDSQDAYVEIWCEKDALAGVIYAVTEVWDVPLMVTRGYPSLTFLYGAAETIAAVGKPAWIYYLGDYDPSGLDIARTVERGLREFAPDADIRFERVAVTAEQIEALRLPTRPTKRTDSRSRNFHGESVELDAIPPAQLREMVEGYIGRHVDRDRLDALELAENSERVLLARMASDWAA
jgi:hypothetical protein